MNQEHRDKHNPAAAYYAREGSMLQT